MTYKKIIKENDVNPTAKPHLDHHPHTSIPAHGKVRKKAPYMHQIKTPKLTEHGD